MPLDLNKYVQRQNIWPMLREYILKNCSDKLFKSGSPGTSIDEIDEQVYDHLQRTLRTKIPQSDTRNIREQDAFRRGIANLYHSRTCSLERKNIWRLCFVLGLNDREGQDLCLNYLHEEELSARSPDEFIILCGLRLKLRWSTILELQENIHQNIPQLPNAPDEQIGDGLVEGRTTQVYMEEICQNINSEADLRNWLEDEQNLCFFAQTRNTMYLALFNDIIPCIKREENAEEPQMTILMCERMGREDPDEVENDVDQPELIDRSVSIRELYHEIFGLCSFEELQTEENRLTIDEINKLATVFRGVFMTYDTFRALEQRQRPVNISSGTLLIRVLEQMDPDTNPENTEDSVDFTNENNFIDCCNTLLNDAGLPALNRYNSFDSLILDTYREILKEKPTSSSKEIKLAFFQRLRGYLKKIAAM